MKRGDPLRKMSRRTVSGSLGRYIAILAIIALGAGFLTGLRVATDAMVATGDKFYREHEFFDFRLISTLGFTDEDVEALGAIEGVSLAEGALFTDFLSVDTGGNSVVLKAHSLTSELNTLELTAGRLPERPDECVLDSYYYAEDVLGTEVVISGENDGDTRDLFRYDGYTVVGLAYSPLYLNYERGNTSLGTGMVHSFVYMPPEGLDSEYFAEIYIKLAESPEIYSDEYTAASDAIKDALTSATEDRADIRFVDIKDEAWTEINDAKVELSDGWDEYYDEKADAEKELSDARIELTDARTELDDGWKEYHDGVKELESEIADGRRKLRDAEKELEDAKVKLDDGETEYLDGKAELEDAETEYADGLAEFEEGKAEYEDGLAKYEEGKAEYEDGLKQYQDGYDQLSGAGAQLAAGKKQLDDTRAKLDTAQGQYNAINDFYAVTSTGILGRFNAAAAGYGVSYADPESYSAGLMGALYTLATDPTNIAAGAIYTISNNTNVISPCADAQDYLTQWGTNEYILDLMLDEMAGADTYQLNATNVYMLSQALAAAEAAYTDGLNQYNAGVAAASAGAQELREAKKKLDEAKTELDEAWAELEDARIEIEDGQKELDDARLELDDGWAELADARLELDDGWTEYNDGVKEVEDGWDDLWYEKAKAEKKLADALDELEDGEAEYIDGLDEYKEGVEEFEEEISDAEEELADAETELADAIEEVEELEPASVYVLGRGTNTGYVCFDSDTQIVAGVAKIFPLFFFLVAALICITTMSRMVDEERTQIGVMKALGYSTLSISRKYLMYAGSASIAGCVIGVGLGSVIFPRVLWQAYTIMYGFADILFVFDWWLALLVTAAYMVCALGVTWYSCRGELREVPAELIRPKSPEPGKRVFLERIPFIWRRLKFLHKVSARNILRYKKRMFMMMLGIGGCTALLVTGFGLSDSIQDFVYYQFDEISVYDCTVTFDDPLDSGAQDRFLEECADAVESAVFLHSSSVNIESASLTKSVYLCATDESLNGFMDFHHKGQPVPYPGDGECIINGKIAEQFGLSVGDKITFRDSDMNYMTLTVSGIFENYIYNYLYTTMASLREWHGEAEIKTAYINFPPDADIHAASAVLAGAEGAASVTVSTDLRDRVTNMMSSMDYIVLFITLCAAALAFIVLYNLTNININERVREIATIKVLGFYANETAAYVFRENMVLSAMGGIVGLPLGKLLHGFVMSQIQIDLMTFDIRVQATSFLYAFIMTLVFTCVVNGIMYFRLQKIDMAESLKSVE